MELKKLTLLLLVFCLTFLCVNTVAAADSDQHVVVWQDGRDGPGTSHLYYKNLKTGEGGRVSKVDSTQFYASISGNIVVWEDDRDGVIHVYYKNLVTGEGGRISKVDSTQLIRTHTV
jgi:beta propeller repeat protein